MSKVTKCPKCGGNIVVPAYPGDGDYPVAPMCTCPESTPPDDNVKCLSCGWVHAAGDCQ